MQFDKPQHRGVSPSTVEVDENSSPESKIHKRPHKGCVLRAARRATFEQTYEA